MEKEWSIAFNKCEFLRIHRKNKSGSSYTHFMILHSETQKMQDVFGTLSVVTVTGYLT